MVNASEDENVEQQQEAAHGDGNSKSGGVALVVTGCQLPQQVVAVGAGLERGGGGVGRTLSGGQVSSLDCGRAGGRGLGWGECRGRGCRGGDTGTLQRLRSYRT